MRSQLTLGVIGHVDHGKTALVRALTGIETDRLEEERQRGLSIVLGFAHLDIDGGTVDLIDVPGHEDFIRTMISGATGLDGVLLIVAANESVMPQTREHFAIARLLGVNRGLIVLTKTDLVSDDALADAEQNVRELVAGSFLQDALLVRVSTVTGDGIDELKAQLSTLFVSDTDRDILDSFFLPIDRVFAMQGFGVVVTGTLRHGRLQTNQIVEILPRGQTASVRALESHREPVEIAYPGQRVAVNLRGVEREDLGRGDVLASKGFLKPARRLDVELELLSDCPGELKNGAAVRLLIGTSTVVAKVRLLGHRALQPGEKGFAQLRCEAAIATHRDERFILRRLSPTHTLGGGRILVVDAERRRRFDADTLAQLVRVATLDTQDALDARLADAGVAGVSADTLRQELGLSAEALSAALDRARLLRIGDSLFVDAASYEALLTDIITAVEEFHATKPKQQGLAAAALAHALEIEPDPKVLRHAVAELLASGSLVSEDGILRRPDFDPLGGLPADERALAAQIERAYLDAGLTSPEMGAVVGKDPVRKQLFKLLLDTGTLVRLKTYDRKNAIVLHRDVLSSIEKQLHSAYPYPAAFTVADVRDLLSATRKSIVPLMEHLDSTGTTIRDGNLRRVRVR